MERLGTVFVTGAAGFIGGRIVERLYLSGLAKVRAGIHHWSTAARIARFPVEIVECNVLDKDSLPRLMEGSDFVVHCAYGDKCVTEEGTENVLQTALEVGVKRFVHLSTVEVYGNVSGQMDESAPLRYSGNEYADSKINAEKLCLAYQEKGLPVTALRPAVVYGPFGGVWTTRLAEVLRSGKWRISHSMDGLCNPVYVDDLVSAIVLALEGEGAIGEAFNIAGPEVLPWSEFFKRLNDAMGLPPLRSQNSISPYIRAALIAPLRSTAKHAISAYPDLIMRAYERWHLIRGPARKVEMLIRTSPARGELTLYNRKAIYSIEKVRKVLRYSPVFDLARGLQLTVAWLKYHGYVQETQAEAH